MAYKIKNAIIKKDNDTGKFDLIDQDNAFNNKEVLVAIDSDDLITIQLLINAIINNDFKMWNEIGSINQGDSVKNLFIKLGYGREDIARLLKEF